jgi:transcriptional regulator with XRE-family HTH domain
LLAESGRVRHVTPPRRRGPRGAIIDRTIIGPFLKRKRLARELTQEEVAAAAGIDRSLYSRYETSQRGMELAKAPQMARALGIEEDEIRLLAEERGAMAELAMQLAEIRLRVDRLEADPREPQADQAGHGSPR